MSEKTPQDIGDIGCLTAIAIAVFSGAVAAIVGSQHVAAYAVGAFAGFYAAWGLIACVLLVFSAKKPGEP